MKEIASKPTFSKENHEEVNIPNLNESTNQPINSRIDETPPEFVIIKSQRQNIFGCCSRLFSCRNPEKAHQATPN